MRALCQREEQKSSLEERALRLRDDALVDVKVLLACERRLLDQVDSRERYAVLSLERLCSQLVITLMEKRTLHYSDLFLVIGNPARQLLPGEKKLMNTLATGVDFRHPVVAAPTEPAASAEPVAHVPEA